VEYELHNLSDADFTFSGPAISMVETVLAQLAPEFLAGKPNHLQSGLSQSRVEFDDGRTTSDYLCQLRVAWRSPGTASAAQKRNHLRRSNEKAATNVAAFQI
jgi:hypothetical protein